MNMKLGCFCLYEKTPKPHYCNATIAEKSTTPLKKKKKKERKKESKEIKSGTCTTLEEVPTLRKYVEM